MIKVMLLDDESWILKDLKELIDWNELGFDIICESTDSVDALKMIKKYKPDVVFNDICMPHISGLEFAEKAQKIHPDCLIIFMSAYNDFTYAQQALRLKIFDYLLKPISYDELIILLSKVKNHLKELKKSKNTLLKYEIFKSIFNLIEFNSANEDTTSNYLTEFVSSLKGYNTLIIKNCEREYDIESLQSEIEILSGVKCFMSLCGHNRYLAIVDFSCLSKKQMMLAYRNIIDAANKYKWKIGMSDYYTSISDFKKSYDQADIIIENDFIYPDRRVFRFVDSMDAFTAFYSSISSVHGKKELEKIVKELPKNIKTYKLNIVQISKIINRLLINIYNMNDEDFEFDLCEAKDLGYSYGNIFKLCEYLSSSIKEKDKTTVLTNNRVIDEIMKDINTNFSKRLLINDYAEKYHLNPCYLSQLFKQIVNKTFTNYIVELRLKKATDLLKNSQLHLYEISEKVGYDDYYHFSKLFKKHTGTTPVNIRKTNMN